MMSEYAHINITDNRLLGGERGGGSSVRGQRGKPESKSSWTAPTATVAN